MSARPGFRIPVAGRIAHFDEAGEGPAVVVAPGLGLSTRFYAPLLEAGSRTGVRWIVPDLPGSGRTPGPFAGSSVRSLAAWSMLLADALELERPIWLGHSIGCQVALEIAAAHPGRAAALILAAPTGAPGPFRLTRQLLALPRAAAREPFSLIAAVARDYIRVLPTAYIGTWLRAGRDRPADRLPLIRCPTLLVAGDRDAICRARDLAAFGEGIASARSEIVRGGGHGLPRDSAEAFATVAAGFIREVLRPAQPPLAARP